MSLLFEFVEAPNGKRYWQVRELADKNPKVENAKGAESLQVRATPALVQCAQC